MTLFGYLDRITARTGETIRCHLSSDDPDVRLDLVRLIHGDSSPDGPGFKVERIHAFREQHLAVRLQDTYTGSCMVAELGGAGAPQALTISALVWPTTPALGRTQGIVSVAGRQGEIVALAIGPDGELQLLAGDAAAAPVAVGLGLSLRPWTWSRVAACIDGATGEVTLSHQRLADRGGEPVAPRVEAKARMAIVLPELVRCVVGALSCTTENGRRRPFACLNGKIEHPVLEDDTGILADWRFELQPHTDTARDVSENARHGLLVNAPARAMTGSCWTGEQLAFTTAPGQYGAIHFHDDDLEDAGWDCAATIELPPGLRSGAYAVRVRTAAETDHIPFVVARGDAGRGAVTLLLPTFTYVAYGNEHLLERDFGGRPAPGEADESPVDLGFHDRLLGEHPEWGRSLYDLHSDGSGVCFASSLRPLHNFRPAYRSWLHGAPRHFAADLYVVDWLEHLGVSYDVTTDHDLHRTGLEALGDTAVVVTGNHPEYVSSRMLDALEAHLGRGGSLMYLGGNGFYWVTSQHPGKEHLLEVRRGAAGTRTWESAPGESHHSTTGEPGGLWRHRGRPPNRLVGIGFSAQLTGARFSTERTETRASPYVRLPDGRRAEVAHLFRGIGEDELIGEFGLVMNGAAGDEIDRYDVARGSPPTALRLASSAGLSDRYLLCCEDLLMTVHGLGGTTNELVRSDIVLVERPDGGAVFAAGSICLTGCLSHNGYENNVARLLTNVLEDFLARGDARRLG